MHKQNKIGRNDLCPCGSGKKYKKCCINTYGSPSPMTLFCWAEREEDMTEGDNVLILRERRTNRKVVVRIEDAWTTDSVETLRAFLFNHPDVKREFLNKQGSMALAVTGKITHFDDRNIAMVVTFARRCLRVAAFSSEGSVSA